MDTQFVVYVYDGIPVDRKKKKKRTIDTLYHLGEFLKENKLYDSIYI